MKKRKFDYWFYWGGKGYQGLVVCWVVICCRVFVVVVVVVVVLGIFVWLLLLLQKRLEDGQTVYFF